MNKRLSPKNKKLRIKTEPIEKYPIHSFCDNNGLLCIPVEIVISNSNSKIPTNISSVNHNFKKYWSPNNGTPFYKWDKKMVNDHVKFLQKYNSLKDCNSVIVILYNTNYMMIDTDDKEMEDYIAERTGNLKIPTTASLRNKGFHRYIKLKGNGNYKASIKIGDKELDIITEYVFESTKKQLENIDSVCELETRELEDIIGYDFKLIPKNLEQDNKMIELENTNIDNKYIQLKDVSREDFLKKNEYIKEEILLQLLNGLDPNKFATNTMWYKLICGINAQAITVEQRQLYFTKFHEFVMRQDNYKSSYFSENVEVWNKLNTNNKGSITSGSLWYWLKEQNKDLFVELKTKRNGMIEAPAFNAIKDYYKQKKIWEETNCIIRGGKVSYSQFDSNTNSYYTRSREDLNGNYNTLNSVFVQKDKSGNEEEKTVPFVKLWCNDPNHRVYDGLNFAPPPIRCPSTIFNTFKGFAVDDYELEEFEKMDEAERMLVVDPILKHIWFISGEEQASYDFMIDIIAHKLQHPGILQCVNMVLRSVQGAGKNALLDFIGNKVIGADYYMTSANSQDFVGRFADGIANKLLCVINEMESGEGYKHASRLKEFATEKTIKQEKKFQDTRTVNNYSQIWYASNDSNPVKIELNDRRFVVFECSRAPLHIEGYFEILFPILNSQITAKAFIWYMRNKVKISKDYNFKLHRPITKVYKEMKNLNKDKFIRFIEWYKNNYIDEKEPEPQSNSMLDNNLDNEPVMDMGETQYTRNHLWQLFQTYADDYNDLTASKWSFSQFSAKLFTYSYDSKTEEDEVITKDIYKIIRRTNDKHNNRKYAFNRNKLLELYNKVNDENGYWDEEEEN